MRKYLIYIGTLVLVIIVSILMYWNTVHLKDATPNTTDSTSASTMAPLPPVSPDSLTETYANSKYKFSFRHPKEYTTTTFPDAENEKADIILVQNISVGTGFQIHIEPIDEDISVLTLDRIKQDLPDIVIKNPQDVILGVGAFAGKGVAFISDDPTFSGASREVWFVFNHNLYQIRTYLAYDPLIQAALGTWEFK